MKKGFTLIELLVVLAIMAVVAVGWPALERYQTTARWQTARQQTAGFFRLAQSQAANGRLNSRWGVKLFSDHLILFQGDSYNQRASEADRQLDFDRGLSLSWQLSGSAPAITLISRHTQNFFQTGQAG